MERPWKEDGKKNEKSAAGLEPKLAVSTTQERLVLGADIIKLEDWSGEMYITDNFADFVRFAKPRASETTIFYNATGAVQVGQMFQDARRNRIQATLNMKAHPRLQTLLDVNGKPQALEAFEVLLRKLKTNLNPDGLLVLDKILDFRVAKIQKIERKKERNGNYRNVVSRESAGTDDFIPPETMKFTVPLFQGEAVPVTVTFDFRFDFKEERDTVATFFTLENLNIEEELLEARKSTIGGSVEAEGFTAYWGRREVNFDTDAWKYQRNPVESKD